MSRVLSAAVAVFALAPGRVAGQAPRYTPADVEFMQGMIAHHAQALDMVALVPERTAKESIRVLAQRIDISQQDESRLMRNWLTERGQAVELLRAMGSHRARRFSMNAIR